MFACHTSIITKEIIEEQIITQWGENMKDEGTDQNLKSD